MDSDGEEEEKNQGRSCDIEVRTRQSLLNVFENNVQAPKEALSTPDRFRKLSSDPKTS